MQIYAIKRHYYEYGFASYIVNYYATKEIAMAHLEDEVAKLKRRFAFGAIQEKISDLHSLRALDKAYDKGAIFEYTPAPNEKPMWLDNRYYPFAIYDENWKEWLKENDGWVDYYDDDFESAYEYYLNERYSKERAGEYFTINQINVIDT